MKFVNRLVVAAALFATSPAAAAQHLDFTGFFNTGPFASLTGALDYDLSSDNKFTFLGSTLTVGSTTIAAYGYDFYPSVYGDLVITRGATAYGDFTFSGDLSPNSGLFFDDGDLGLDYRLNGSNIEYGTQNVQLHTQAAAVPEPATWAMMLLGFGAMGVSMRRRRQPVSVRLQKA